MSGFISGMPHRRTTAFKICCYPSHGKGIARSTNTTVVARAEERETGRLYLKLETWIFEIESIDIQTPETEASNSATFELRRARKHKVQRRWPSSLRAPTFTALRQIQKTQRRTKRLVYKGLRCENVKNSVPDQYTSCKHRIPGKSPFLYE